MDTIKKNTTKKKIATPTLRMKRTISLAGLKRIGACVGQRDATALTFDLLNPNDRVQITAENVRAAWDANLNIDWLMYRVLGRKWIGAWIRRRRALNDQVNWGKITYDEYMQKKAESVAKLLQQHWGTRDK